MGKGRPQSEFRKLLEAALIADDKAHKDSLIQHAISEARKDNTLLAAILRKLLPDLKAIDVKVDEKSPFRLIIDLSGTSDSGNKPDKHTTTKTGKKLSEERIG